MDGWMDEWMYMHGWMDGWIHTHTPTHTYTDTHTQEHTHTHSPVASPFYVLPLIRHFLALISKCTDSSTDQCSILMLMCEKRTSWNPLPDKKFKTFLST